jgi:hypothetical protein
MSLAHAQKYYDIVAKDPALLESLGDGAQSVEEFVQRAIQAASQQGLVFTAQEARSYLAEQSAVHEAGELSDQQLEEVAGGKGRDPFKNKRGKCNKRHGEFTVLVGYSWGWT